MLGVFHEELLEIMANVLKNLSPRRSLVFHGCGLDELSCLGPSKVIEVSSEGLRPFLLDPKDFGLKRCAMEELKGQDAAYNAKKIMDTFEGERGGFADTLILNAGVAAFLYGTVESVQEGIDLARQRLQDRSALKLLNQWISHA
jgi:anthranilate phosphoribosyltransferase